MKKLADINLECYGHYLVYKDDKNMYRLYKKTWKPRKDGYYSWSKKLVMKSDTYFNPLWYLSSVMHSVTNDDE